MEQNIHNRIIISLAYKITDHFPMTTLFGGIVRDVIAPGFIKGAFPFGKEFVCDKISDIDIMCLPPQIAELEQIDDEKEDTQRLLWVFVDSKLRPKLREWDWWVEETKELDVYNTRGIRLSICHELFDLKTHLDIISVVNSTMNDADVNKLRFSKEKGLFLADEKKPKKIRDQFDNFQRFQNILRQVQMKQCRMICSVTSRVEGVTILRLRRFVKMLRKGWEVLNINQRIVSHRKPAETDCMICHTVPDGNWIELSCSRCNLCLDCFGTLIEKNIHDRRGTFKCPTCREEILPWQE